MGLAISPFFFLAAGWSLPLGGSLGFGFSWVAVHSFHSVRALARSSGLPDFQNVRSLATFPFLVTAAATP